MGRIKSTFFKKTGKKLAKDSSEHFSADFEKNKKVLRDVIPNKRARNIISGYVTRLARRK